jgi:hypothetical protein
MENDRLQSRAAHHQFDLPAAAAGKQTSRSRQSRTGVSAPYQAAISAGRRSKIVLKAPRSRIRAVPEPMGIDVDRRRDHPVDLAGYRVSPVA